MGEKIKDKPIDSLEMKELLKEDLADAIDHGIIVSNLATLVAGEIGLDKETCHQISVAGMLHDIGKLKLSKYLHGRQKNSFAIEEIKYIQMHSILGYEILKERGYDPFILQTVYYHHENYDGTGYPENLAGESIPIGARIIRTCDVFAALVSTRSYREAFDIETAIELMIDEVKNFDMKIFLAFQRVVHSTEFEDIREYIKLCSETSSYTIFDEETIGKFDS